MEEGFPKQSRIEIWRKWSENPSDFGFAEIARIQDRDWAGFNVPL